MAQLFRASGPETRMIDTPALPDADARAKIVSILVNPLFNNNKLCVH
jgi:hypothetical protein